MSTKIIIDSTVDLPDHLRERTTVIPLIVRFGEEEYQDGVTIDYQQFYEKLLTCKDLPCSSQPSPDTFETVYQSVTEAGDEAVVLTISSKLSGTYQSACIAAEDFPNIHVVDTMTATVAAGVLARYALKLADDGLSAAAIAAKLEEEKCRVRLFAVLDSLEFLKRGGRLSAGAAMAGSLLNIKPVITLRDGVIEVVGKARGLRRGNAMMTEQVEHSGGIDTDLPVQFGFTGLSDELMRAYITDNAEPCPADTPISPIGSVIGTHAGPGAYAIAFFSRK